MSNTRKPAAKKAAAPKKLGLKAALAQKKSRLEWYDLPLEDSTVVAEKAGRVRLLSNMAESLRIQGDDASAERADRELADAKAELAKCFQRLYFRGLPEERYDELLNEHPPTDEQVAEAKKDDEGIPQFNPHTFFPTLLEECYVGNDGLTAAEWAEELKEWARAEKHDITQTVIRANTRAFSDGIPKD